MEEALIFTMNRVVGDETPDGCTREFHILGKKIIKWNHHDLPVTLITAQSSLHYVFGLWNALEVWWEVTVFCFGRVGDGNANFAEMTGRQRPPDVQVLTLGVYGGAAGGGKSNSGG